MLVSGKRDGSTATTIIIAVGSSTTIVHNATTTDSIIVSYEVQGSPSGGGYMPPEGDASRKLQRAVTPQSGDGR